MEKNLTGVFCYLIIAHKNAEQYINETRIIHGNYGTQVKLVLQNYDTGR